MTLLHVARGNFPFSDLAVFHLNHGVHRRADETDQLIKQICQKEDLRYFSHRLTTNFTTNREDNWRRERRFWSKKIADQIDASIVVTAHQATDLVETMIFRLTKGCGLGGLAPFDLHSKPFWRLPKSDLLHYATVHNLSWIEDPTNDDMELQRNLLRQQVLPVLRQITPNLEKVFVKESEIFASVNDFLTNHVQKLIQQCTQQTLLLSRWHALPAAIRAEWLRQLSQTTVSRADLFSALRWLDNCPRGQTTKQLGRVQLAVKNKHLHWQFLQANK